MALITRLSRLFQADFHAVLDRIEEPDIQLKQAVREMEFDLRQDEQSLALLQHEGEQLAGLIEDSIQRIAAFDEEMDICFAAKKDDLARDLIRRKLETVAIRAKAEKSLNENRSCIEKLDQRLQQHRQQLDNMRQKLELLVDQESRNSQHRQPLHPVSNIRSEDVEIAYLREKQRRANS